MVSQEDTGSVLRLHEFNDEKKARFLSIAKQFWPNLGAICEAVGISRWTVYNHRKSDPEFNKALIEIDEQVCDDHEFVLRQRGMKPAGFLDRIAYLKAHRSSLYNPAKVVKIEGYKMGAQEKLERMGAVESVIDAEIVKTYQDRKQRQEQKRIKADEARAKESGATEGAGS